jgi:glycosyltransferase involved in cell wall biosynthesis
VAKPVVAFNSGGISEVVCHGTTGFLVEEGDWRALAENLLMLLRSPELRTRFGRSGREKIVRQFDLEHCTKRLEAIYGAEIESRMKAKREGICHHSESIRGNGSTSVTASPRY